MLGSAGIVLVLTSIIKY